MADRRGAGPSPSRGFTLAELLIAVAISSILFVGIAAMLATAFRSEVHSIRQQMLQSTATNLVKRLQRDAYQSSAIVTPTANSSAGSGNVVIFEGYENRANLGGTAGWRSPINAGAPVRQFIYRVCNTNQLSYWRWDTTQAGVPGSRACGATTTPEMILVGPPIQIRNWTTTFRDGHNQIRVELELVYPQTVAHSEMVWRVSTDLTPQAVFGDWGTP